MSLTPEKRQRVYEEEEAKCPRHGAYTRGRGCPDCRTERRTGRLHINVSGEDLKQHYLSRAKYHNEQHNICQARIRTLQDSGNRDEELAKYQGQTEAHAQRAWSYNAIANNFVPGKMYRVTEEDIDVFEGPSEWLTRLLNVPAVTASKLAHDHLTPRTLIDFRTPKRLCIAADPSRVGVPANKLFNEAARGFHQKLQEAWILARLGVVLDHVIAPVIISVVDAPLLDGIVRFSDNRDWGFEVVTAYAPGRQLGMDYRDGRRPTHNIVDYSGARSDPSWIRPSVLAKVAKAKKHGAHRHLVTYLDYSGGVPDAERVAAVVADAEDAFETTWLLTGIMFCLLFGQRHVRTTAAELNADIVPRKQHDKALAAALERRWMSYLSWLPNECRP